jgi:hypothetical protein
MLEFSKEFKDDIEESYLYWLSKQSVDPKDLTITKWLANIIRKPIYDLLGEKRANTE